MQWFNGWTDATKRAFSWVEASSQMPYGSAHRCTHRDCCIRPGRPLNDRTQKGLRHRLIKTRNGLVLITDWQKVKPPGAKLCVSVSDVILRKRKSTEIIYWQWCLMLPHDRSFCQTKGVHYNKREISEQLNSPWGTILMLTHSYAWLALSMCIHGENWRFICYKYSPMMLLKL